MRFCKTSLENQCNVSLRGSSFFTGHGLGLCKCIYRLYLSMIVGFCCVFVKLWMQSLLHICNRLLFEIFSNAPLESQCTRIFIFKSMLYACAHGAGSSLSTMPCLQKQVSVKHPDFWVQIKHREQSRRDASSQRAGTADLFTLAKQHPWCL